MSESSSPVMDSQVGRAQDVPDMRRIAITHPLPLFDNFSIAEVQDLLQQHTTDTGQVFPTDVQQEIYRLSQGQPWLTNGHWFSLIFL